MSWSSSSARVARRSGVALMVAVAVPATIRAVSASSPNEAAPKAAIVAATSTSTPNPYGGLYFDRDDDFVGPNYWLQDSMGVGGTYRFGQVDPVPAQFLVEPKHRHPSFMLPTEPQVLPEGCEPLGAATTILGSLAGRCPA